MWDKSNNSIATVKSGPVARNVLLDQFDRHFHTLTAQTFEQIQIAEGIRYQVYCVENRHENANNGLGRESDEFDSHAAQSLLFCRATNIAVGTVRLILPISEETDQSFPLMRLLNFSSQKEFSRLPLLSMGEISRFSISQQFRRMHTAINGEDNSVIGNSAPMMRAGLMRAIVRMSMENAITHWCALMAPALMRMLAAMGLHFIPIGPLIEFRGHRQPCHANVLDILEGVRRTHPAIWSVITNGGRCPLTQAPERKWHECAQPKASWRDRNAGSGG